MTATNIWYEVRESGGSKALGSEGEARAYMSKYPKAKLFKVVQTEEQIPTV